MSYRLPNKNIMHDTSIMSIDEVIDSGSCWFTEKRHSGLVRCQQCQIKFDLYSLKKSDTGKFLCKFCIGGML